MRLCTRCKIEKPVDQFGNRKHSKDGIRHECKECTKKDNLRYRAKRQEAINKKARERRKLHPEVLRENELKWYHKNHKKKAAYSAQWYRDNKERVRDRLLKRKYGITSDQYDTLLKDQGYRCAICMAPQVHYKVRFAVDHSHVSNKIRGILCMVCNRDICGVIDKRAKSRYVNLSELEYVTRLYEYYRKSG